MPLKSGVDQVLQFLSKAAVPAVVATSSPTDIAKANLKLLSLFDYMTAVLGGEQVEQGKPSPEIYLKAAGFAGCDARECAAFKTAFPVL